MQFVSTRLEITIASASVVTSAIHLQCVRQFRKTSSATIHFIVPVVQILRVRLAIDATMAVA